MAHRHHLWLLILVSIAGCFWILSAVLIAHCSDEQRASLPFMFGGPPITEAKAGVIVTNSLLRRGGTLSGCELPKTRYDFAKGEWSFFYTLKPPGMPGGHFTVIVDKTGKTQYFGGK